MNIGKTLTTTTGGKMTIMHARLHRMSDLTLLNNPINYHHSLRCVRTTVGTILTATEHTLHNIQSEIPMVHFNNNQQKLQMSMN